MTFNVEDLRCQDYGQCVNSNRYEKALFWKTDFRQLENTHGPLDRV